MTFVTDVTKLLNECQRTEDAIFDIITFHSGRDDLLAVQEQILRIPELISNCRESYNNLFEGDFSTETFITRNSLRYMRMRLEAIALYVKNYFKSENTINL
jgi:hypothetical protein